MLLFRMPLTLLMMMFTVDLLYADDAPFSVKPPIIKQGNNAVGWENILLSPQPYATRTTQTDNIDNTDADTEQPDADNVDSTIENDTGDQDILSETDIIQEIIPDDTATLTAEVNRHGGKHNEDTLSEPSSDERKWGEWYGPPLTINPHTTSTGNTNGEMPSLNGTESAVLHDKESPIINGFSLSLWGTSSLVLNTGVNYTWNYIYSSLSFGTDLTTPDINRPYFLGFHAGGNYPVSSFLIRADVGYRLGVNHRLYDHSDLRQHQFEFRTSAGYRVNKWFLIVGGAGVGYGLDRKEQSKGKFSPLFFGGVELF